MNEPYAIEITDLDLHLDGKPLLQGFQWQVASGQKVLVTGPSGCGKSSLLKCILGLLQPVAGAVCIQGVELNETTVWTLRRAMAYVAQEPELGAGTVREALERPFAYQANRDLGQEALQRVPHWFERLFLPVALLDKSVTQLSGGEKQRVALVAALLLERPILLLDEITSALDPDSRQAVARVLAEQTARTVLMISHDPTHFDAFDQSLAWSGLGKGA